MRTVIALTLLLLVTGCAHYEFDLVQPAQLQRHIGKNVDQVVPIDPLEYRLRTVDNRLLMRVFNNTDEPIQLRGDKSAVVDPGGQSHPLRTQPIAPHSYIKLIFPPVRPRIYDPGPHFGVGVGVGVSRAHHRDPFYPSALGYHNGPRYLYLDDDSDARYWDWRGEGEARMTLVYQRGGDDAKGGDVKEREIRHDFTFRRRKM